MVGLASHGPPTGGPSTPPGIVEQLVAFLSDPKPRLLLIEGPPGSGKSSLLRELRARLPAPRLEVAYRVGEPGPGSAFSAERPAPPVSVELVAADGIPPGEDSQLLAAIPATRRGGGAASETDLAGLPEAISRALATMARLGSGTLLIDEWSRARSSSSDRVPPSRPPRSRLAATADEMTESLAQSPVHTVVVMLSPLSASLQSMADGVVRLGFEEWPGPPVRLLTVQKLNAPYAPEPRHPFTLDGGRFYAPKRAPPVAQRPPLPPDDDPAPAEESLWPGSTAFAGAFGRLRFHTLGGLELTHSLPEIYAEPFWEPVVRHVVRAGGHAVVVPSAARPPSAVVARLAGSVPAAELGERLRLLAPSVEQLGDGLPAGVLLPLPGRPAPAPARDATAHALAPQLPDAYRFLAETEPGRPALFLISLSGLRSLAAVAGLDLDPRTLPLLIQAYATLPRFVAFGFGAEDDPLARAFSPLLATKLRLDLLDGRAVLRATEPPGRAFLVEWPEDGRGYRLLKAA